MSEKIDTIIKDFLPGSCSFIEQDDKETASTDVHSATVKPVDLSSVLSKQTVQQQPPTSSAAEPIKELHGFKEPRYLLQQERYEHRVLVFLKAEGKTNEEIAAILGRSNATIGYWVKQPTTKQMILEEIHRRGGNAVQTFMTEHAMKAAETLVLAMDAEEMEARRDRVDAANKLLDRVFGKPTQPIEQRKAKDLNHLSDEELADIAYNGKGLPTGGSAATGTRS